MREGRVVLGIGPGDPGAFLTLAGIAVSDSLIVDPLVPKGRQKGVGGLFLVRATLSGQSRPPWLWYHCPAPRRPRNLVAASGVIRPTRPIRAAITSGNARLSRPPGRAHRRSASRNARHRSETAYFGGAEGAAAKAHGAADRCDLDRQPASDRLRQRHAGCERAGFDGDEGPSDADRPFQHYPEAEMARIQIFTATLRCRSWSALPGRASPFMPECCRATRHPMAASDCPHEFAVRLYGMILYWRPRHRFP